MIYILPALISFTLGLLILKAVLRDRLPGALLTLFLGAAIGLGASGFLTFTSFLLFNQLIPAFVIALNLSVIAALMFLLKRRNDLDMSAFIKSFTRGDLIALGALIVLMIPMLLFASLYPYGGWDAWGSWNVKARFLFLGGASWSYMFDPILWRSQILYPFLLPLMNVWFWCFGAQPTYAVPMAMTCVIPLITAGMLYAGLKAFSKSPFAILAPVWIFSNMFIIQLSGSQYSDLLVGMFLLIAIILWLLFQRSKDPGLLILMGVALGMLAFTKVEGTSLAVVTLAAAAWLMHTDPAMAMIKKKAFLVLTLATTIAALPAMIYFVFYAPRESGIFINGLTSAGHPTSLDRLMFVIRYAGIEFTSMKWNGLWLALAACILVCGKTSWRRELRILPVVLGTYVIIFILSYWINTFYDITWWTTTSMNRVILAMAPSCALWAFLCMEKE